MVAMVVTVDVAMVATVDVAMVAMAATVGVAMVEFTLRTPNWVKQMNVSSMSPKTRARPGNAIPAANAIKTPRIMRMTSPASA